MRNEECRSFLGLEEVLDDTVGLVLDSSKEDGVDGRENLLEHGFELEADWL